MNEAKLYTDKEIEKLRMEMGLQHREVLSKLDELTKPKSPIQQREPALINSILLAVILYATSSLGLTFTEADIGSWEQVLIPLGPAILAVLQGVKTRAEVYSPETATDRMK